MSVTEITGDDPSHQVCTSCTSSQPVAKVGDGPLVISNLIGGDYTACWRW